MRVKEVYYRLEIWQLELTHKVKNMRQLIWWSVTILRMVTHLPKDGHKSHSTQLCLIRASPIWLCLTRFEPNLTTFYTLLAPLDLVWPNLVPLGPFDPVWLHLALSDLAWPFWPWFTPFGPILTCVTQLDHLKPYLTLFDPVWPHFFAFGPF